MNAFIVELKNKPGELARATEAIAQKGINILGFTGATCGDSGTIVLLTNDESGTKRALGDAGYRPREVELVVARLAELNWKFESVNFMAPAATVDLFKETLLPRIKDKTVKQFRSFHLNDAAEQQDPTCKPVLGYGRSLLYLVSESFEGGVRTPLLGMEKYFDVEVAPLKLPNVKTWVAPGPATASTTHGGFDDDKRTMESIINLIKGRKP